MYWKTKFKWWNCMKSNHNKLLFIKRHTEVSKIILPHSFLLLISWIMAGCIYWRHFCFHPYLFRCWIKVRFRKLLGFPQNSFITNLCWVFPFDGSNVVEHLHIAIKCQMRFLCTVIFRVPFSLFAAATQRMPTNYSKSLLESWCKCICNVNKREIIIWNRLNSYLIKIHWTRIERKKKS